NSESATEFKAKSLAFLDEIEQRGEPITITRRGLPVAVLGPRGAGPGSRRETVGPEKLRSRVTSGKSTHRAYGKLFVRNWSVCLPPRFVLDTQVAVRWPIEAKTLSRERIIESKLAPVVE